MRKIANVLAKLTPAITACLSFVLLISANTNSCVFFNEPDAPAELKKFKRIK